MAQTLKDEVKERIQNSALSNFAEHGFRKTTMSEIADQAKISVGNIYRYYTNKEDLFYSLITPGFVTKFKKVLVSMIQDVRTALFTKGDKKKTMKLANKNVIDFVFKHRLQIVILLERSHGTIYETVLEDMLDMVIKDLDGYLKESTPGGKTLSTAEKKFLVKIIYRNYVHAVVRILNQYESKRQIEKGYTQYMDYHLFGMQFFWS